MTKWTVRTRATVDRFYVVEADDEKAALAASVNATPDHEEDVDEETMEISAMVLERSSAPVSPTTPESA